MRFRDVRVSRIAVYLILIASASTAIVALVVLARRTSASRNTAPDISQEMISGTDDPIPAEADVFRTDPSDLAIDPTPAGRRFAHPRTLKTYRALRAYPGAPPRIPHGLTPAETLRGGCKTCHERGGYSQRFGAYVPVTPHPEMGACLQCHVGDARLLPTPLPGMDPNARCRQCHSEGGMLWRDSATNWKALPWPEVARVSRGQPPPAIPHDLELRGNCLTCHSAPSAVKEITTSHPERANCRQCHVHASSDADEFTRAPVRVVDRGKGAR